MGDNNIDWEIIILKFYFVLPILVYCHNFPTLGNTHCSWKTIGIFILFYQCWYNCNNRQKLGNVVIHWKINGIVIVYQLWYTRKIFQHWKVLVFTGKSFLYFNNLGTLKELENTVSSSWIIFSCLKKRLIVHSFYSRKISLSIIIYHHNHHQLVIHALTVSEEGDIQV